MYFDLVSDMIVQILALFYFYKCVLLVLTCNVIFFSKNGMVLSSTMYWDQQTTLNFEIQQNNVMYVTCYDKIQPTKKYLVSCYSAICLLGKPINEYKQVNRIFNIPKYKQCGSVYAWLNAPSQLAAKYFALLKLWCRKN